MELIKGWSETAKEVLKGRYVIDARYLTVEECEELGWTGSAVCISLGTKTVDGVIQAPLLLYASNDSGDDAGCVMVTGNEYEYFPIIELQE